MYFKGQMYFSYVNWRNKLKKLRDKKINQDQQRVKTWLIRGRHGPLVLKTSCNPELWLTELTICTFSDLILKLYVIGRFFPHHNCKMVVVPWKSTKDLI
jgi:hypothetical protein